MSVDPGVVSKKLPPIESVSPALRTVHGRSAAGDTISIGGNFFGRADRPTCSLGEVEEAALQQTRGNSCRYIHRLP